jgi:hypothetical protein
MAGSTGNSACGFEGRPECRNQVAAGLQQADL